MAEARALLDGAEQEEQEATARLARVKRDDVNGDLTAAEWRKLRAELKPESVAAKAEAQRLRRQLAEAEADTARAGVEVDVLETLARIRAAVVGEVVDAEGAAAVHAVLMRLFDGFVLHRAVSGGSTLG